MSSEEETLLSLVGSEAQSLRRGLIGHFKNVTDPSPNRPVLRPSTSM